MCVQVSSEGLRLRTTKGVFISWALVFGWEPLLLVWVIFKHPAADPESLAFYFVVFGGTIGMYLWLRAFTLEIDSQEVRYSTLFGGTKSIALSEIAKIEWRTGYGGDGQITKPPIRLEITPKPRTLAQPVTINAKVFDGKGLAEFVRRVEDHAHNTQRKPGRG